MTFIDNFNNSDEDYSLETELFNNEFYKKIILTDEFQRLRGISFLGAIDKTHDNRTKIRSNRFEHSIDVAKLALYVCKERRYNKDTQQHVVAAALLHDIGHAPLSHSMESEFDQSYGINHHIASSEIINGQIKTHSSINKAIREKLDINIVLDLIEQKSNECFADIFASPINVDTIDGIHKSLKYLKPNSNIFFNKYSVTKASFFDKKDSKRSHILDDFWKYKGLVYEKVITSGLGAMADHISKVYFNDNLDRITEEHFLYREQSLFNNRKPIFQTFNDKLKSLIIINDSEESNCPYSSTFEEFNVIKRNYKVNLDVDVDRENSDLELMKSRFVCLKEKAKTKVHYCIVNKEPKSKKQLSFLSF